MNTAMDAVQEWVVRVMSDYINRDDIYFHKDNILNGEAIMKDIKRIKSAEVVDKSLFDRARTLLKATYELLNKQVESYYVLNILEETIFYDNAECDGSCLMEDIDGFFLEIDGKGLRDE